MVVFMKNLLRNRKLFYAILTVAAVFMIVYPYMVKSYIMKLYREQYADRTKDLNPQKKQEVDEALRHIEKGEIFEAQEHDTEDYMHTDYFGEPWRIWANTFVIWYDARNLFLLFLVILALKPYINKVIDRLNIANLRAKGINAAYNEQVVHF
jgi:hypothetical protein